MGDPASVGKSIANRFLNTLIAMAAACVITYDHPDLGDQMMPAWFFVNQRPDAFDLTFFNLQELHCSDMTVLADEFSLSRERNSNDSLPHCCSQSRSRSTSHSPSAGRLSLLHHRQSAGC
jgi:hypothetical protein